jgi:hypothetical protein
MSKTNPGIKIVLDKERTLLLDLNAMVSYEEVTGKSLFNADDKSMGARELRAYLWACLIHEDESLTLKQVGSWINTDNMAEVAQRLTEARNEAVPETTGETAGPLPSHPNG